MWVLLQEAKNLALGKDFVSIHHLEVSLLVLSHAQCRTKIFHFSTQNLKGGRPGKQRRLSLLYTES